MASSADFDFRIYGSYTKHAYKPAEDPTIQIKSAYLMNPVKE